MISFPLIVPEAISNAGSMVNGPVMLAVPPVGCILTSPVPRILPPKKFMGPMSVSVLLPTSRAEPVEVSS